MAEPQQAPKIIQTPDLLSVVGAHHTLAGGSACVGVVMAPLAADLRNWKYFIYGASREPKAGLHDRVQAIVPLLSFSQVQDAGYLQLQSSYDRIASFDGLLPKLASLTMEPSVVTQSMLKVELAAVNPDLVGFNYLAVDPSAESAEILEWADCLYSVVSESSRAKPRKEYSSLAFLEGVNNTSDLLIEGLRTLELKDDGRIKTADPLVMACIYSIGRAEWLSKTGQSDVILTVNSTRTRRDA